ncbi:hypothetical protein [Paenibacillus protaetiae]|uniref:Uncharacterized protein n=1 Tax=Paenibacillus protaetiae TaxID=2509456 RepID=A0A4P6ES31_9BACL|nr:hypothetical protein [Paenibacillus protaetiae]QAY65694.1 hypothetical protein ET464_04145 [Paenibacillus protaetiae]
MANETVESWNNELERLRDLLATHNQLERKSQQIRQRLFDENRKVAELSEALQQEEEDVHKLLGLSWSNLVHTLLRNKEERLATEQEEAAAAALKLQNAKKTVADLEKQQADILSAMAESVGAEAAYHALLQQKEQFIRGGTSEESNKLGELDEQLRLLRSEEKELREANNVCTRLVGALSQAGDKLESAKNWGTYDMLGGGFLSTAMKHSRIDEAQDSVYEAQYLLKELRSELSDLKRTTDIEVNLSDRAQFADYFFDGFIVDWIIQDKIKSSIGEVDDQLSQAVALNQALTRQVEACVSQQQTVIQQRKAIIEQFA